MKATYKIPEFNWEKLQEKLKAINRKCLRLGFPEIKITVLDTEFITVKKDLDFDFIYKQYNIEIEGETPKIDGWEFLATLEHTEKGNIIRNISGNEIPEKYKTITAICEHCNINRFRIDTFILKNEITGEYKQVGRNCLADFLGGKNPHNIAMYCEYLKEIFNYSNYNEDDEDFREFGYKNRRYYEVKEIIKMSAYIISEYGYVKSADAFDLGKTSTSDRVKNIISNRGDYSFLSDEDAEKMMDWAINSTQESEYFNNLKVLCRLGFGEWRDIGIIASIPISYKKFIDREREKSETKNSEYLGKIGDRISITVKLEKSIIFENMYGTGYIHLFKDNNGNVIKWNTSIYMAENYIYDIVGKIKAQQEYKGTKQTELTRCKYKKED